VFSRLECYTAVIGIYISTFRDSLCFRIMGHQSTKIDGIFCSGRRVTNYQTNLRNITEEQKLHVPFSDYLKSCVLSGFWSSRRGINIRRTRYVRNV